MKTKRHGFTLIELLVVIVIIAILAALLLPSLRRARQRAQMAFCTGNLRQLGFSLQMYVDDNGSYFPYQRTLGPDRLWYFGLESPFTDPAPPASRSLDLTKARLYPYFRNKHKVEICPSYDYHSSLWRQKFKTVSYGYGLNWYLFTKNAAFVTDASRIMAMADTAQVNTFQPPASPANPMLEEFYYLDAFTKTAHFRHLGRANVLFCDGHVEPRTLADGTLDTRLPSARVGQLSPAGDMSLFQ